MYEYKALCTRVIDGDTAELNLDLGFNIHLTIRGRLFGVDAPELFTGTEKDKAILAKKYLEELILNKYIIVNTYKDKTSFNRWVVELKDLNDNNINLLVDNYCRSL